MIKLLLRKCLQGLMMILIVSAVTFALLGFAGGDALTQLRDNPQISEGRSSAFAASTVSINHFQYGTFGGFPARSRGPGRVDILSYARKQPVWARSVSTFCSGLPPLQSHSRLRCR
jgi:hypothetical protein